MANWQRGPHGYTALVDLAMPTELASALEGNKNFQKGEAFQRDEEEGTPQTAPKALQFQASVSFGLLAAFERKHHAELRGVNLNGRLDRLHALVVKSSQGDEAAGAEYAELVQSSFASIE